MAYKLVRESSETPNITNQDDTMMVRYAYGDYNGVVKNYGEELSVTIDGSTATVHKGRAVVNGWEVDVDGNGVVFSALTGQQMYYSIMMLINLANESVKFDLVSNSGLYPETNAGDDLTAYPQGYRRIVTHHLYSENGVFVSAERVLPLIPYLADLEKRVEELGFKEGFLESAAVLEDGTETGLGGSPMDKKIIKQGKMAVIRHFSTPFPVIGGIPSGTKYMRYYIPKGFEPVLHYLPLYARRYYYSIISGKTEEALYSLEMQHYLEEDGSTVFYFEFPYEGYQYYLANIGWQIE